MKEADVAYDDLTDEDAYALAQYLGYEKVAEIQAQAEYEKLAEAQYELGQIMAHGFNDELEKIAKGYENPGVLSNLGAGMSEIASRGRAAAEGAAASGRRMAGRAWQGAKGLAGSAGAGLKDLGGATMRLPGQVSELVDVVRKGDPKGRAGKRIAGLAGQVGKGLVLPGAGLAAAYGAKKMYDRSQEEKRSSDAEVYHALAVLADRGLL